MHSSPEVGVVLVFWSLLSLGAAVGAMIRSRRDGTQTIEGAIAGVGFSLLFIVALVVILLFVAGLVWFFV